MTFRLERKVSVTGKFFEISTAYVVECGCTVCIGSVCLSALTGYSTCLCGGGNE